MIIGFAIVLLCIIPVSAQVDDGYTKLLMHFNGTANSTSLLDEAGHSVYPHGTAQVYTSPVKFGSGSLYSSGDANGLTGQATYNFTFTTTQDFTIDFWYWSASSGDYKAIFHVGDTHQYVLETVGGYLYAYAATIGHTQVTTSQITNSRWNHIAVVKNGTDLNTYVNGILNSTVSVGTVTWGDNGDTFGIMSWNYNNNGATGYLDELRISRIARWTANFIPPTAEYLPSVPSNPPVANWNATPNSTSTGNDVVFVDLSTNSPTSWYWELGDGTISTRQNITHAYSNAGLYTVNHNATNADGTSWLNRTNWVLVTNGAPDIIWNYSPLSPNLTSGVYFVDSSSGANITRNWSFGDGKVSSSQSPHHTYANTGFFNVNHSVVDSPGTPWQITGWSNATIYVSNDTPTCDFSGTPLSGFVPLSVQFTDLSTGIIDHWNWTFGDGNYSSLESPLHQYDVIGLQTVTLKIWNPDFADLPISCTKANYVNVTANTTPTPTPTTPPTTTPTTPVPTPTPAGLSTCTDDCVSITLINADLSPSQIIVVRNASGVLIGQYEAGDVFRLAKNATYIFQLTPLTTDYLRNPIAALDQVTLYAQTHMAALMVLVAAIIIMGLGLKRRR